MGLLFYADRAPGINFEDRTLMHLRVVIVGKLRHGESFAFSFAHGHSAGSGRSCLWLGPAIPLQFVFHGNRTPSLNRTWIAQLAASANSPGGLVLTDEPQDTSAT